MKGKSSALLLAQAAQTSSVSHSQFDKHLIMPRISRLHPLCVALISLKKNMYFAASSRYALSLNIIIINPFSLLPARSTSHSHGSQSHDWVFLTGYKWRPTHRGRNCVHPYPILRRILKILEELSTFTFHQPTRWVGLTNRKSTSLCQSTIPIVQKLTYSVREINIPNIVWDNCGMPKVQN
jgi:hypothetical protein